jgi:AbrB family looped-hinge helix DNA binding protein
MGESQLTSKGQVTIPLAIRIALNLKTGDKVHFVNDGDRAILVPARGDVYSLKGILKGDKGKPLGVAEMREMAKSYVVRRYDEHRKGSK